MRKQLKVTGQTALLHSIVYPYHIDLDPDRGKADPDTENSNFFSEFFSLGNIILKPMIFVVVIY